jgi:hypothetical protein
MSLLEDGPHTATVFPEVATIDGYRNPYKRPADIGVQVRCTVTPIMAQPLVADAHRPVRVLGDIRGELVHAPLREGLLELARAGLGRRDDELDVLIADQAGRPHAH